MMKWAAGALSCATLGAVLTSFWIKCEYCWKPYHGVVLCDGFVVLIAPNAPHLEANVLYPLQSAGVSVQRNYYKPWSDGPLLGWPRRIGIVVNLTGVVIPPWVVVGLPATLAWVLWLFDRTHHPAGHCRRCGYDLTGNLSGRCPECGVAISVSREVETGQNKKRGRQ